MNSNKVEAETREVLQKTIGELEHRSAHLKDYNWLLKVPHPCLSCDQVPSSVLKATFPSFPVILQSPEHLVAVHLVPALRNNGCSLWDFYCSVD